MIKSGSSRLHCFHVPVDKQIDNLGRRNSKQCKLYQLICTVSSSKTSFEALLSSPPFFLRCGFVVLF